MRCHGFSVNIHQTVVFCDLVGMLIQICGEIYTLLQLVCKLYHFDYARISIYLIL